MAAEEIPMFEFIHAAIRVNEPPKNATAPKHCIRLAGQVEDIPTVVSSEGIEEVKAAVARARGVFTYTPLRELTDRSFTTEEQKHVFRELTSMDTTSDEMAFHFAMWAVPAIDAAYEGLGKKIAAWVYLITLMVGIDDDGGEATGDQGSGSDAEGPKEERDESAVDESLSASEKLEKARDAFLDRIAKTKVMSRSMSAVLIDWAASVLDACLDTFPESTKKGARGRDAPLYVIDYSNDLESAFELLVEVVGRELSKLADMPEDYFKSEVGLIRWGHVTRAAGTCFGIMQKYKTWALDTELVISINKFLVPGVFEALSRFDVPRLVKLYREDQKLGLEATHCVRMLTLTGFIPALNRLIEYYRDEEDEEIFESFEEEYDNSIVMDGAANFLSLGLNWKMWGTTKGHMEWIDDIKAMDEEALLEMGRVHNLMMPYLLLVFRKTDASSRTLAHSTLLQVLLESIDFHVKNYGSVSVPSASHDISNAAQILCLLCARDGSEELLLKLKFEGMLPRLLDLVLWCQKGPEPATEANVYSEKYLLREMCLFLMAALCRGDPRTSDDAAKLAAGPLLGILEEALQNPDRAAGKKAAEHAMRPVLGCLVTIINASYKMYMPGYEKRAQIVSEKLGATGFGLREAVDWLKMAPTSSDSGDFRGWIFPIPARMSLLFILQFYMLHRPDLREDLIIRSTQKCHPGDLYYELQACIASDMKFVRQLSQGKIKYDSSGDKRIAVLRGAQTVAAWLQFGMVLKLVRLDLVLECMASAARLTAGWMATNDSILPEAADEVPEVHLCFCCWASLQVHDLMEEILTTAMDFLESSVEESPLDEVIYARKDELRAICRVLRGAEKDLDAYLLEVNKGPNRKKTRFWGRMPERLEAVMVVADAKAAARAEEAKAVADAAMAALLAEEEGSQQAQQEAEEKKRIKRQKQKEKLRAAKEAAAAEEQAKKDAAEAAKREIEAARRAKEAAIAEERARKQAEEAAKKAAEEEKLAQERAAKRKAEAEKKRIEMEKKKAEAKERKAIAEALRLATEAKRLADEVAARQKAEAERRAREEAEEHARAAQAEARRQAEERARAAEAEARRQAEELARAAAALEVEQARQAQQAAERAVEYLGFDTKSTEELLMDSIRYQPGFETVATPPLTESTSRFTNGYFSTAMPAAPPMPAAVPAEPSVRHMGATQDDLKQLLSLLLPGMETPAGSGGAPPEEERPPSYTSGNVEPARPARMRPAALPPHTALAVCVAQPHRWAALETALRCPVSGEPLFDPVIFSDGTSYDRDAAEKAGKIAENKARPNLALRQLMHHLCGH